MSLLDLFTVPLLEPHMHAYSTSGKNANKEAKEGPRLMPIDIRETPTQYAVRADLPGCPKESLKVTVDDGVLKLEAERARPELAEGHKEWRSELWWGKVHRAVRLPDNANDDAVAASFENGVLVVTVDKKPEVEPRQIEIQ